ncbi:hypothetical protein [Sabulibacter ruber]|uniref:hypothetical protein n=1 Tax=Sabulibacter ruber TaxID=2811901 RepID=UPI001A960BF1|nr:hypothetical protein [Sabulibacter ruber]
MKADYLTQAQAGFAILTLLCLLLSIVGVHRTFLRMGLSPETAAKRTRTVAALLVGWLAFTSILAWSGFMANFSVAPLNMMPALLPPLVVVLVVTFHGGTQRFIRHLPAKGLLNLQAFRIPVEVFLWWLFLAQALPERMTFEGQNWDVLSGIAGPVFALLCYGGTRYNQKLATFYNLAGLALLLNIVATGMLSLPTPFRVFFEAPGSGIMATFPVMFLPTFLVPLAYTLHFFSLRKAALERKEARVHQKQRTVTA